MKPKYRNPVRTIPTKYLKNFVANDGMNESGTRDYGPLLEEIQTELHRRCLKQDDLAFKNAMKQTTAATKLCTVCKLEVPAAEAHNHFYTKKGKLRAECKACSKDKIKHQRQLKKIETPF